MKGVIMLRTKRHKTSLCLNLNLPKECFFGDALYKNRHIIWVNIAIPKPTAKKNIILLVKASLLTTRRTTKTMTECVSTHLMNLISRDILDFLYINN